MRMLACQTDIVWEDKAANCRHIAHLLEGQSITPGTLIVLPEMCATGFSMNVSATAEGPKRETEVFLADLARRYRSWVVGGVVTAAAEGKGRNQALVCGPDGTELARYTKVHPLRLGEQDHYLAGDRIARFTWQGFNVAPFICYDLRFPELFREATRRGAELLLVIASWPQVRHPHWAPLLRARAIENQAFVVGVNRCGQDPHHGYLGESQIVDFYGHVVASAGDAETVLSADLDVEALRKWRREFPSLEDLRPGSAYQALKYEG